MDRAARRVAAEKRKEKKDAKKARARERMRHPKFKDELTFQAKEMGLIV